MVWWISATIIYVMLLIIIPLCFPIRKHSNYGYLDGFMEGIARIACWGLATVAYLIFWIIFLVVHEGIHLLEKQRRKW